MAGNRTINTLLAAPDIDIDFIDPSVETLEEFAEQKAPENKRYKRLTLSRIATSEREVNIIGILKSLKKIFEAHPAINELTLSFNTFSTANTFALAIFFMGFTSMKKLNFIDRTFNNLEELCRTLSLVHTQLDTIKLENINFSEIRKPAKEDWLGFVKQFRSSWRKFIASKAMADQLFLSKKEYEASLAPKVAPVPSPVPPINLQAVILTPESKTSEPPPSNKSKEEALRQHVFLGKPVLHRRPVLPITRELRRQSFSGS